MPIDQILMAGTRERSYFDHDEEEPLTPVRTNRSWRSRKATNTLSRGRAVFRKVFQRGKLNRSQDSNDTNLSASPDRDDGAPISPTDLSHLHMPPAVRPVETGQRLTPRTTAYLPEVREGRRKSSASDYLQSDDGRADMNEFRYLVEDNTVGAVGLDTIISESSNQSGTPRETHISRTWDALHGVRPSAQAQRPVKRNSSQRSSRRRSGYGRVVPWQGVYRGQQGHQRNLAPVTSMGSSLPNASADALGPLMQGIRLSPGKLSPQRNMLMQTQTHQYRLATELPQRLSLLDLSKLKTRSQIVEAAIPNQHRSYRQEWTTYLRDYCAGRYNIIDPPNPPRRHSAFTYLPALDPNNEDKRMAAFDRLNPEWTTAQEAAGYDLIGDAQREFKTTGAAISLIISNLELFKVEEGYGFACIDRTESIAAHALLTTEVLVVLDTHKDWRFCGNPLVTKGPQIRFFAGAPMMTTSGAVIGVFAIVDYEPREDFTAIHRRRLTDYASATMARIMPRSIDPLSSPIPRPAAQSPPRETLVREQMVLHDQARGVDAHEDLDDTVHAHSFGTPAHRHVETPSFAMRVNQWNSGVSSPEQASSSILTPTLSDEDMSPPMSHMPSISTMASTTDHHKNQRDMFLQMHHPNMSFRFGDGDNRSSPAMNNWTPRPYSGSDLTSVDERAHPNTPAFDSRFPQDDNHEVDYDAYQRIGSNESWETQRSRQTVEYAARMHAEGFNRLTPTPERRLLPVRY